MSDRYWMQKAYEQALLAQDAGEVPVGAVLISPSNELIAVGRNQVEFNHDPTGHAEVQALRSAASIVKNHRLTDCTLFVTLEPCAMCAGLMVHARIGRLVYATRDFKAGAAGSVFNLLHGYPLNHKVVVDEGIMERKCSQLLSDFFQARR